MNYDQTEKERVRLSIALREEEVTLAEERNNCLPLKDDRFPSELSRRLYMEARTARQQAVVDKLRDEAERLRDRAQWLIRGSDAYKATA